MTGRVRPVSIRSRHTYVSDGPSTNNYSIERRPAVRTRVSGQVMSDTSINNALIRSLISLSRSRSVQSRVRVVDDRTRQLVGMFIRSVLALRTVVIAIGFSPMRSCVLCVGGVAVAAAKWWPPALRCSRVRAIRQPSTR